MFGVSSEAETLEKALEGVEAQIRRVLDESE